MGCASRWGDVGGLCGCGRKWGERQSSEARWGIHLCARVRCEIFLADMRAVDMRVDLSRRDIGVAEHLLDGSQIGPTFEQMGRKRMAQRLRMQVRDADGKPGARDESCAGSAGSILPPRTFRNTAPLDFPRPPSRIRRASSRYIDSVRSAAPEMGATRSLSPFPRMRRYPSSSARSARFKPHASLARRPHP